VWAVAGCTVQPLTPTPAEVTAPPVAVAVVTFTPAPTWTTAPSANTLVVASATPEALPSPTESALTAPVINPTAIPTDVPVVTAPAPAAIPLPTEAAIPQALVAPPPPEDAACALADPQSEATGTLCEVAAAEQHMIDLINAERAAAGVAPLLRDETLMGIARARVADMVARGYTGHNDPVTGESLARSMMRAAGYTSSYVGENWYGSLRSPSGLVDVAMAWFMTDPPHAQNILSPNYVGVGAGIAFSGQQWLLVQDFAGANP